MRPDPTVAASLAIVGSFACIVLLRMVDLNEKEPAWALALLLWLGASSAAGVALLDPYDGDGALGVALESDVAKLAAIAAGLGLLAAIARLRGWSEVTGPVDGAVYGAAAGLGFAIGEGMLRATYASPAERQIPDLLSWPEVAWMTLQSALTEAAIGALIGAGLVLGVRATSRTLRIAGPLVGVGSAVLLHTAYTALLEDAAIGPEVTVATVLAAALVLGVLVVGMRYALGEEAGAIATHLDDEVGSDVLSEEEFELLKDPRKRHREYWHKFRAGDLDGWLLQRALQDRQVQLALLKQRGLDEEANRVRAAIRARRRREKPGSSERGSWAQRLSGAGAAAAFALLLLIGGVVLFVEASGDQPATTIATRAELAAREDRRGEPLADDVRLLRDSVRRAVGRFRMAAVSEADALGDGALASYEVDYRGREGARLGLQTGVFESVSAARESRSRLNRADPDDGAQRVWREGRVVNVVRGRQAAVDDFCVERQGILANFVTRVRRSVPPTWRTYIDGDGAQHWDAPDGGANLIASASPADSQTSEEYARAQGPLLARGLDGYREVNFTRVPFRDGETAYRRIFTWTFEGLRVKQIQVYFVDDCDVAYQFTFTPQPGDFARYRPLFDQILSSLVPIDSPTAQ